MEPVKKKKKILFLITKSNWGGAQKYVFELANEAKDRGYAVVVALGGTGAADAPIGELGRKLTEANIRTVPVHAFTRDMSLLRDIRAFLELWKLVQTERPDVLHVTSSKAGGIGALVGRLRFVPKVIFTSHGLTMDESWRPWWQRMLITWATWLTVSLSHVTILINTDTYERARRLPLTASKIVRIFNGIAPFPLIDRAAARKQLVPHMPPDAIWIGGIGELHANKNWAPAIEALHELPSSTHLIIIGEGEKRAELETLTLQRTIQERVHFVGQKAAAPLLSAFDVFVLPSHKEGLPYVLLEAGLAGLPVVASNLPGNRDIITSNESGLLITPTKDELAAAFTQLIGDKQLAKAYGQKLKSTIETTFSLERMFQETFALYDS